MKVLPSIRSDPLMMMVVMMIVMMVVMMMVLFTMKMIII